MYFELKRMKYIKKLVACTQGLKMKKNRPLRHKNRGIFQKNPGIFRVLDGPKGGGVGKPPKTHRIWSQQEK